MTQAPEAQAKENAADEDIARVYLGAVSLPHRYGVHTKLVFAILGRC